MFEILRTDKHECAGIAALENFVGDREGEPDHDVSAHGRQDGARVRRLSPCEVQHELHSGHEEEYPQYDAADYHEPIGIDQEGTPRKEERRDPE